MYINEGKQLFYEQYPHPLDFCVDCNMIVMLLIEIKGER